MANNEKTCWACKRILVGDSKLGLCSDCLNKYGSPAAAAGLLGLAIGGRFLVKNGGRIVKAVAKGIKIIKL